MLEFSVLGSIGCSRDGVRVELGGAQQRRMLAVLLSDAGRVVPLDRMIEAIWADDPPDRARRTTMSYVSRLRSALGDGVVITVEPGYRIEPGDGAVDAVRFEGLVDRSRRVPPSEAIAVLDQALGLWQGPAYGEFAGEWWALPHAARLDGLRLAAAEERIDALLAVGDCSRAVADLEALIPAHPLSERLVAQLMRAYDAEGRKAEALRTFQDHRERLADQTGLDPGSTLTTLERSIILWTEHAPADVDRTLRGYVLGDVLGQGANGTVYRSVQPGVDREVAVKVIRADRADDPAFVQRFEAEAQVVAHLEHPHIVPLYDFWREPGGAYLVFRLLRGGSARDAVLADGPWPLERVSRLVDEVGGALVAAHAAGVVHRDVKPSNILFDASGNSYLVDFGIATDRRRSPTERCTPPVPAPRSMRHQRRSGTTRPHRRRISTAWRSSSPSS
jgi:DNA-binding SARP family transcriptional activator/tRNA A-37 threonylcarbamoyl transferase component Bud32